MIEIQGARKVYQMGSVVVEALRGVSFSVNKGEFIAIMGPSGSGKSTLMNIIGCLDRPTSGEYRLNGNNVRDLSDNQLAVLRNKEIGFVFQQFHLLPRINLLQNVELPLIYAGISARERHYRAKEALKMVGLEERAHHKPNEISGGQKQRAAIARALINKPSIILADEPTGNLDSKTGILIMNTLIDLHQLGNTVVLVTHDPEISAYANRIIRLLDGEIVSDEVNARRKLKAGGEADALL